MLLFTLPGTLTMYYGEEIGMVNVPIAPEDVQDPAEKNEPGIGMGRDPERTPMQWDSSPLAGFTTGRPWVPIAPEHRTINVEAEDREDRSLLTLYRALIAMRRNHPVLVDGTMQRIDAHENVLRYQRAGDGERLQILLNLGHSASQVAVECGVILKSTCGDREGDRVNEVIELRAAEGLIIAVDGGEITSP
jgi:alpha-glucosidase